MSHVTSGQSKSAQSVPGLVARMQDYPLRTLHATGCPAGRRRSKEGTDYRSYLISVFTCNFCRRIVCIFCSINKNIDIIVPINRGSSLDHVTFISYGRGCFGRYGGSRLHRSSTENDPTCPVYRIHIIVQFVFSCFYFLQFAGFNHWFLHAYRIFPIQYVGTVWLCIVEYHHSLNSRAIDIYAMTATEYVATSRTYLGGERACLCLRNQEQAGEHGRWVLFTLLYLIPFFLRFFLHKRIDSEFTGCWRPARETTRFHVA